MLFLKGRFHFQAYNTSSKAVTVPSVSVFDTCQMVAGRSITCKSEIYQDEKQLRESKESIERQISILKKQLEEMQVFILFKL